MAALVCLVAILAIAGVADGAWCVCRSDVADSSLQKALDYACGAGADCTPIIQGGSCYNPNTVRAHCSYAVNSYYQKKGQSQSQSQQACDFAGAATLTNTDPSASTCSYPATASGAGTSTGSTSSTTPGSATPGSNLTPTTTTTGGGMMGGGGGGLGPSGNSMNTDSTDDAHFPRAGMGSLLGIMLTVLLVVLIDYC